MTRRDATPGAVTLIRLPEALDRTADPEALERRGRSARTLINTGAMRIVALALAPGGTIPEHTADGPISIHVLRGRLRFRVGDREHVLETGDLLHLDAGVEHAVASDDGAAFLLTLARPTPPDAHGGVD